MSESSQFSQQRAFHCPKCNGRIVIPSNLPSTTGPCPHCQETITSPAPEIPSNVINPALKPGPAAPASPAPAIAPAAQKPAEVVEKEDSSTKSATKPASKKSDKSTKRSSPIAVVLILFLLIIALGGGGYFGYMKFMKKGDSAALNTPMVQPQKPAANPVLAKYLAASSLEEKINFVYNAEEVRPKMEAIYKEGIINEGDTPANAFQLVPLPETDQKKGFILLSYDQPAPAALNGMVKSAAPTGDKAANKQRTKVLAFLKETEEGVKLDWEVFAQTKYRLFNNFTKTPTMGNSGVFRLIVTKNPAKDGEKEKPTVPFLFKDPAHSDDKIEIQIDPKSPAGSALAQLTAEVVKSGSPVSRTATVELAWAGDPNNPKLEVKKFICWEFLGLGGKETAGANPSN